MVVESSLAGNLIVTRPPGNGHPEVHHRERHHFTVEVVLSITQCDLLVLPSLWLTAEPDLG